MANNMLTTVDNPFDPFEQFASWLLFDAEKGYNTCEYLARIANVSDSMSDKEVDDEMERAIDEIIQFDVRNIYKKVRDASTQDTDRGDEHGPSIQD